ncbi:MAG TPA: DUF937 domain-containing protein [Candidatus Solibacter sp.]|jgi:hypothetical protein
MTLENVLSLANPGVVDQLAGQFGINPQQAASAVSTLLPAIAGGLKEKLASGGGAALSDLISRGSLAKFADNPASLASPDALTLGNSMLSQIFGSGDLSNIASTVAQKVGISSGVITAMLPIATALLGGLLSKSTAGGKGNLTEIVGALAGGHGVMDAIKGFASKVLG